MPTIKRTVLHVDGNTDLLHDVGSKLTSNGYEVISISDPAVQGVVAYGAGVPRAMRVG